MSFHHFYTLISDYKFSPKAYLVSIVCLLLSLLLLLPFIATFFISESYLPSFKNILLKSTGSPRVIFDGGSNLHHGINSRMLTEQLSIPVVNLGDNGGYPLAVKVERLKKELTYGDILILSPEWYQYYTEKFSHQFYADLYGSLNHYYDYLPYEQKIRYFYSQGLIDLIDLFKDKEVDKIEVQLNYFSHFKSMLDKGIFGDFYPYSLLEDMNNGMDCQNYLFSGRSFSDLETSRRFESTLKDLSVFAKEKGVMVFFIPPVVVDSSCYQDADAQRFLSNASDLLQKYGFPFLIQPEDAVFERELMNNTYYHLNEEGRDLWSTKIFLALKDKVKRYQPSEAETLLSQFRSDAAIALDQAKYKQLMFYGTRLPVLSKKVSFSFKDEGPIHFIEGWSGEEQYGRWSDGNRSVLLLRRDLKVKGIKLLGEYFHKKERSKVLVNNRYIGEFDLTEEAIPLAGVSEEVLLLTIEFTEEIYPDSLGMADPRKLRFNLQAVEGL